MDRLFGKSGANHVGQRTYFQPGFVFLSLLTLVTFTAAQSLYEVLAGNPRFITIRITSNLELVELVLLFNFLPPAILFAVWLLLRQPSKALAQGYLATVYGLLFLLFFWQLHNRPALAGWQELRLSYVMWIAPAAILALASLRFQKVFRSFILALSPVILLFPALFLVRTWASVETGLAALPAPTWSGSSPATPKRLPPVFLIVLDELPLHVLLDENGEIDGTRYPHFRKLAASSHWFRNATANADSTYQSVPSILTGTFPVEGKLPSARDYPNNLLNLVHPHYQVYVYEWWERFCVAGRFHCVEDANQIVAGQADLLGDIFRLYILHTLPRGADFALPFFLQMWGQFQDAQTIARTNRDRFDTFMDAVAGLDEHESFLFFFHHALPHSPYFLGPEGQILDPGPAYFSPDHVGNQTRIQEVMARFRMQIMCLDNQVGRFLARLKELDLYDKSLLMVTADHGVSFRPEAPGRSLKEVDGVVVNADLVLTVPLFVKLPFQQEGTVSRRDVQLVDIVPTLADLLGMGVPWKAVGRNMFGPEAESRAKVAYDVKGKRYELPADLGLTPIQVELVIGQDESSRSAGSGGG